MPRPLRPPHRGPRRAWQASFVTAGVLSVLLVGTSLAMPRFAGAAPRAAVGIRAANEPSHGDGPAATAPTARAAAGGPRVVVLQAYTAAGQLLSYGAFRRLESNGHGSNGYDDALLDPTTLEVISIGPLYDDRGSPALRLPGRPAALALAWPTSDGYSNLIIDLPPTGGTRVFDLLAAAQVVGDLDQMLAARPWYVASSAFTAAFDVATNDLSAAQRAGTPAEQGVLGAESLDAAIHAQTLLLEQAGEQYAAAHPASGQQWGVTFDEIRGAAADLGTVEQLYGPAGWVRIVLDLGEPPSYYTGEIAAAHALGLHVLGELCDSSYMKHQTLAQFEAWTRAYVSGLPGIDEWEIGNEVNGNWLGPDVAAKVGYAAGYVKQHTGKPTLLTLYWQLGEGGATSELFTWAHANLRRALLAQIDDIGISLYPQESPMGPDAFDRVLRTLHAEFPAQRILVTENGYGGPGVPDTWWWGSPTNIAAGRLAVAQLYQSAALGYPFSGGGTYWWYYLEEALPTSSALWSTLAAVRAAATG